MITYIIIAFVAFIQSMIFTLNSRSRASGDTVKHFFTAILSHGCWFLVTFILLFPEIFNSVAEGTIKERVILLIIYSISSSLGGLVMMKINLGHWKVPYLTEEGKSRVGSR